MPVIAGDRACSLLDGNDRTLLYGVSTFDSPGDLFAAGAGGSGERRLTELNEAVLGELHMPKVEHLHFPGVDGVPVEGWIMKPPERQPPHPTILYTHGGPHGAFGNAFHFEFHMLAGAGFAVLFVNYSGSSGYDDAFGTRLVGEWGNYDYRDSMAGVDHVIARGLADPDRLGCAGLSYGGYMSCWIVGQTDRFKASVPENPLANLVSRYGTVDIGPQHGVQELGGTPWDKPEVYVRSSPITYAHRYKTPTLLIQGESDYRCTAEQAEQFYAVLKATSCPVEMLRLPGMSHGGAINGPISVRRAQNEALLDWMKRYVLGEQE